MRQTGRIAVLGLVAVLAAAPHVTAAQNQGRPYIGYTYPAGGKQGTTFQARLGGQGLDGVNGVFVSGGGVQGKVIEYLRRLNPQDMQLLREQLSELRRSSPGSAKEEEEAKALRARIERRTAEYVQRPACASISSLAIVELTVAADAEPGERELRLVTPRGVSNPLVFCVGQLPEYSRKAMLVSSLQVLGKEESALRKRPAEEVEVRVQLPCTLNGQIASGEVNRYRFEARKGQRLVISADARQLIPYIADAVPGWFQPVLMLCDASGKELAYDDDYRFKPDPVILYEVPKDGEYVLHVSDAIYRGREDFVYRVTLGEVPFVTSVFPLGGRAGSLETVEMKGWNLDAAELKLPGKEVAPGIHPIAARRKGFVSNRLPFQVETLPECFDQESNDDLSAAQKIELPVIINGRMDRAGDWDVFQFHGRAGDTVVVDVAARRLASPIDSLVKFTDASGKLLAFNDDRADAESGVNTHHADSYLSIQLPADGRYYVHLCDTARGFGDEYGYRLRVSMPRPDFALRVVPSSLSLRNRNTSPISVYAIRKDGFNGPIKLSLKEPPAGLSSTTVSLPANQDTVRLTVKCDRVRSNQPLNLTVEGRAKIGDGEIAREAAPAEDRMQAFLWRHLVPCEELTAMVYNPIVELSPKRVHVPPADQDKSKAVPVAPVAGKQTFTKQQVAGRLRQLRQLFDEWLITDRFYDKKVAECEAVRQ